MFSGRIHLNTDRVEIRGETRLDISFVTIRSVEAGAKGALTIEYAGGRAVLAFGDRATAEKWAIKIRSLKSLLDKLGVKPESRVVVLDVDDAEFAAQLEKRLTAGLTSAPGKNLDFIFYAADAAARLVKLKSLRARLQPAGAVWVVSRKGKEATIRDLDVMEAAQAAGWSTTRCAASRRRTRR